MVEETLKKSVVNIPRGRVLAIGGSDSSGGAGIQADVKTVTALGGYAATAVTALTAQSTEGVLDVMEVPPRFIEKQIALAIDDIGIDAIKTGMLHRKEVIQVVSEMLASLAPGVPLVVDTVMVAKGGHPLLAQNAIHALKNLLLPRSVLVTPNIPEAELLAGIKIESIRDMKNAASLIFSYGTKAVLIKGGHMQGEVINDILFDGENWEIFESMRIETRHTHGTGCTLASGIATFLARGASLGDAVFHARKFVFEAIRTAPGFGRGHGPLNHSHTVCLID